jgi:hypothetical protein
VAQEINVYWLTYHDDILERGYWDQALLEDIFKKGNFKHHTGIDNPKGGGIVIINGRTHVEDTALINDDIAKLDWVLFIETGDEEAVFPWREIHHKLMRVWIMMPRMNQHDDVSFRLPNGYRPETCDLLKEIGIVDRTQDFFFAGQVTHERREQCRDAAVGLIDAGANGRVVATSSFGEEAVPYREYLEEMAKTKFVLCPSGPESPDNFRLYEALEAGCVPIVDAFSTQHKAPGFWKYVFGDGIPFPIVDYWDALPKLLPELLRDYPRNANKCFAWWQGQKKKIADKLYEDVKELSK